VYIAFSIIYTNSYRSTPKGGDVMQLDTIGKNIRKYRLAKKLRQEDLAEKAGLSANYIGMVERGEKIPSLETFITILNALEVSADMVLADVVSTGYIVKNSILNEKLSKLSNDDREKIYEVIDTLIKHSKQIIP
jgi:transcriptional regulator with XRE-family HTH domain